MITSKPKTSRTNSEVPSELRLGLLVFAALVLTSAMPAFGDDGVAQCTAAPSGLVGWWPGDDTAKDITPKDHDGTFNDADATYAPGEVRDAFSLDGADEFVDVPNKADLTPGNITVDAWINPTGFTATSPSITKYPPSIVNKGNVGNYAESYALFVDPTSKKLGFLVNTKGTAATRDLIYSKTSIPVGTNTWTFVAGTYDGKSVHVYVNGVLDDLGLQAGTATGPIGMTANDLLIGKADRTPSVYTDSYFEGKIDEVEIFSRALSGDTVDMNGKLIKGGELGNIYRAGSAGKCKCQEKPAEAEGDMNDDDGHTSHVSMTAKRECDDNGEVDYKDDTGKEMHGKHKSIAMSGNKAIVSGQGYLLDGTTVDYTAVLVGNQPLIGSLFSMTWTTATGEIFNRTGVMTNGGYVVVPQQ